MLNSIRQSIVALVVVYGCMLLVNSTAQADPTVEAVVKALDQFRTGEVTYQISTESSSTYINPKYTLKQRLDLAKNRSESKSLTRVMKDDCFRIKDVKTRIASPYQWIREQIFVDGDWINIGFHTDPKTNPHNNSISMSSSQLFEGRFAKNLNKLYCSFSDESFVFGVIAGQKVSDFLTQSVEPIVSTTDFGSSIVAVSPYGKVEMLIDRASSLPYSICIEQKGDDIHYGRKMSSIVMNEGGIWPAGKLNAVNWQIDVSEIRESGGVYYFDTVQINKKSFTASGDVIEDTTRLKAVEVDFAKVVDAEDFRATLTHCIGQEVYIQCSEDSSETLIGDEVYYWDGLKAVPKKVDSSDPKSR